MKITKNSAGLWIFQEPASRGTFDNVVVNNVEEELQKRRLSWVGQRGKQTGCQQSKGRKNIMEQILSIRLKIELCESSSCYVFCFCTSLWIYEDFFGGFNFSHRISFSKLRLLGQANQLEGGIGQSCTWPWGACLQGHELSFHYPLSAIQ